MWMGYSQGDLGARLGVADTQVRLLCIRKRIFRESAEKIAALFEELCMTAGPSVRARNYARRQGYAPPLAWLDIDDPREVSLTEIERDHAEAREINRRRLHQEWKRARRAAA